MTDQTVYATIEQGTTEWLARILEPDKAPTYFVPGGIYRGIAMSLKRILCKAVNDTYGADRVVFVSETLFNKKVEEQNMSNKRTITIPEDWPEPEYLLGQEVYIHSSDHPRIITGMRLDERDEPGLPPCLVWQYRAGERWWYEAVDLSTEPKGEQVAVPTRDDFEFLQDDETLP